MLDLETTAPLPTIVLSSRTQPSLTMPCVLASSSFGNPPSPPDAACHRPIWRGWEKKKVTSSTARRKATGKRWPDAYPRHPLALRVGLSHTGQTWATADGCQRNGSRFGRLGNDLPGNGVARLPRTNCSPVAGLRLARSHRGLGCGDNSGIKGHRRTCSLLPEHHKDPVEPIIIATAIEHQAQRVSVDGRFPEYLELAGLLVQE